MSYNIDEVICKIQELDPSKVYLISIDREKLSNGDFTEFANLVYEVFNKNGIRVIITDSRVMQVSESNE